MIKTSFPSPLPSTCLRAIDRVRHKGQNDRESVRTGPPQLLTPVSPYAADGELVPTQLSCTFMWPKLNCRGLTYNLLEGAISSHDGYGFLHDPGGGEWSYLVRPTGGGQRVPLYSATSIVTDCKGAGMRPFLCKIDIEGGEAELFRSDFSWLGEFAVIVIELHDWLFPGSHDARELHTRG